jgi:hypothetical protein
VSTTTTNYGLVKPATGDLVDPTGGAPSDLNGNADIIDARLAVGHHWSAADSGYVQWTADPACYLNSTLTLATHTYYLSAMRVHKAGTFSKVGIICSALGTRTDLRFAAYNAAGTRLATTGNVTSSLTATGFTALSFSTTPNYVPGVVYVVGWSINSATFTLAATTTSIGDGIAANGPAGATTCRRFGSVSDGGSGTDIPASLTISSGVVSSPAFVCASTTQQFWCSLIP